MYQEALNVLKKICDKGYLAYIVGGYARDRYLNIDSNDIDICTNASYEVLQGIFSDCTLTLISYGSMRLIYNNITMEITTFRKEIGSVDNRYPDKVVFVDDLYTDLLRRDFVINTLCIDCYGNYVDLMGAREDIDKGIVRMVGNPMMRLEEDSLRILRAIRFATVFDCEIDSDLEKAIIEKGKLLESLSLERKKEELDKIFCSSNVLKGIGLLKKYGLCSYLHLSFGDIQYTNSYLGIWAQCKFYVSYPFSKYEKKQIELIQKSLLIDIENVYNWYDMNLDILDIVCEIKGYDIEMIHSKYNRLPIHSVLDLDINGSEVLSLLSIDVCYVKDILNDLVCCVLKGKLSNNKKALEKYILDTYST